MTREEAIHFANCLKNNYTIDLNDLQAFCDEVIKALEQKPITSKDQFIYALTACGCLLKDGKTWYEHDELIKCFEDLGLFDEQETKDCSDCEIVQVCVEACIKSISRVLYEKDEALDMIKEEIGYLRTFNPYTVAFQQDVLNVIDKYKTESEG